MIVLRHGLCEHGHGTSQCNPNLVARWCAFATKHGKSPGGVLAGRQPSIVPPQIGVPLSMSFVVGDAVELHGLLAQPELNDLIGVVTGVANENGRFPA